MKIKTLRPAAFLLSAALMLTLPGCGRAAPPASVPADVLEKDEPADTVVNQPAESASSPEAESPPQKTPEPTPAQGQPEDSDGILAVSSMEEVQAELAAAIGELRQPRNMNIAALSLSEHPDLDIKNLYYSLLSENRSYCYAYDLAAEISEDILSVVISYMPYRTGEFPADFEGESIASLAELISVAKAHLGAETLNIRVTDTELTPDDMNRALQQVGGGYIICTLNADATAITFAPSSGFTMEECLDFLRECDALAEDIVSAHITDDMDDKAKARTLYGYLTENVKYDHRYYADKANMPFHSQTAYGALQDGLAICGGYSHGLKLLFEKAGIPCLNVSGVSYREYHMWSYARIDGEWLYFDATADRGKPEEWWKFCGVEGSALEGHTWDDLPIIALAETL